jgi:hypothetical protein
MTALKNLPIAIPPKSEQEEIFDLVNKYLSLADRVEQFCQKAKDNGAYPIYPYKSLPWWINSSKSKWWASINSFEASRL